MNAQKPDDHQRVAKRGFLRNELVGLAHSAKGPDMLNHGHRTVSGCRALSVCAALCRINDLRETEVSEDEDDRDGPLSVYAALCRIMIVGLAHSARGPDMLKHGHRTVSDCSILSACAALCRIMSVNHVLHRGDF